MAAPAVQFAPLGGGGRVAFHVLGKGPAIAMLFPYHVNHLSLNWRVPLHKGAMQFLARHFTVLSLGSPGAGLSCSVQRQLSLASLSDALDTVREAARIDRLGLCVMGAAGLIACHFAAHYPTRVTRLVFIAGGVSDANRQLLHLRQTALAVEAELRGALPSGVGDKRNARALAAVARAALDTSALAGSERLLHQEDLLTIARNVSTPALYVHGPAVLPERSIHVRGVRGQFPALTQAGAAVRRTLCAARGWRARRSPDERQERGRAERLGPRAPARRPIGESAASLRCANAFMTWCYALWMVRPRPHETWIAVRSELAKGCNVVRGGVLRIRREVAGC